MRLVKDPETKDAVQDFWNILIESKNLNKAIRQMHEVYGIEKGWNTWSKISKSEFYSYTVALCVGDAKMRYLKEELAKAADYLLRYRNVDVSFAVGYTEDDVISISARSKGNINVDVIGPLATPPESKAIAV